MTSQLLLLVALAPSQVVGGAWGFHHTIPGTGQVGSSLGREVAPAGDLDGDGVVDFFATFVDYSTGQSLPSVRWISGATGASLHSATGPRYGDFGHAILAHPDWDGDGFRDLVVGAPMDQTTRYHGGAVTVWSGLTGVLLERIEIPIDDAHYGSSLSLFPDSDGDGRDELLVGAVEISSVGTNEHGAVFLMSSAAGTAIRPFDGAGPYEQLGSSVACLDDLDGDGVAELVAGSNFFTPGSSARVTCFSGASAAVLWVYSLAGTQSNAPWALVGVRDLDGDGIPDVLVGQRAGQVNPGQAGMVALLSGASGTAVWERYAGPNDPSLGRKVGRLEDADGDGREELVATAFQCVEILDPATGAERSRHDRWDYLQGASFGEDLDGDARPDWVVGLPSAAGGSGHLEIGGFEAGLVAGGSSFSAASGCALALVLDFPDQEAGRTFHLLASLSGTGPWVRDGVTIPLTVDGLLRRTALHPQAGPFDPPRGLLDYRGDATSRLVIPPGAGLPYIGRSMQLAAVSLTPPGTVRLSSVANPLAILP